MMSGSSQSAAGVASASIARRNPLDDGCHSGHLSAMVHPTTGYAPLMAVSIAGLVVFLLVALVSGPLPGDVPFARTVQQLVPPDAAWAATLTEAAKMPWLLAMMLASGALTFRLAGVRGLLLLALGLALAFALDAGLRASFHVPKPTPDLVAVVSPAVSSGLPSTFALRFGAMLGVPLLLALRRRRWAVFWLITTLFAAGFVARVAPGGHWPSQMLATWAMFLPLLAVLAQRIVPVGDSPTGR